MNPVLTSADVLAMRMRALGLVPGAPVERRPGSDTNGATGPDGATGTDAGSGSDSGADRIAAVARHMLALQGQDWRSSRWALGVRAAHLAGDETTLAHVAAAFTEGRVVRTWPMRGTIHVVPAEDIGWVQSIAGARPLAGAAKRRAVLGLSDALLERLVEVSVQALRGGDGLSRGQLAETWTDAGIEWRSNWRYHVIWWLCQNGVAVFGPTDGVAEPRLVLAEEWIRDARTPEHPAAELAARYAAGRGPVRAKDLAWWAGIPAADAALGLDAAVEQGRLTRMRLADTTGAAGALWAPSDALETGSPVPEWLLLPAFDEHLLGYALRDPQLDPAHFERIVPGRNGMFLATVLHRGRVAGTWKRAARAGGGIEVAALPGARIDLEALAPEAGRWAAFHGLEPGPIRHADAASAGRDGL
ncbi:winged helix DNA-binding domain-containing protein [Leucobacter triazinivorans]|uniref:Winged helix DNA-binding domain-containing protein n=1 Tax=Leucobacter triazinivorans TaxID=1784719 RepID=A0A4P6KHP3_9MICO|nr:winged helix DNA-binding domain-containing protein [Leucobacter triazinivorans]QBE49803.1 winged helix DNA-binding domain-containing protein [Leucobacter triazinivorans]